MANTPAWFTVGWLVALLVAVLCVVFVAIHTLDPVTGLLIGATAVSRILP